MRLWLNWQKRTAQDRVEQSLEVQVLSVALCFGNYHWLQPLKAKAR